VNIPQCPEQIVTKFHIQGGLLRCREFGSGHINDTYKIDTDEGHVYILQRINPHVFTRPVEVMENVSAVTDFLRKTLKRPRETLHFLRTDENLRYYLDENGDCWRCYEFTDGICLEAPETEEDFYESAIAFGRFQEMLSDFPAESLHETIPLFHNTPNRYRNLLASIEKNAAGRVDLVREDIAFLLEREKEAGIICDLLESGALPLRVTHNDTKINNVLLDSKTKKALCVIDLDTVMPGSSLYDYGDSIRFGAATAAEDEQDLEKVTMSLNLFRVYTAGYLKACKSLTPKEIELLPMGAKMMTLEVAVRFLTDYLDGDVYFKTAYSDHNLVRARTQMKLVWDMEQKWEQMQAIVAEEAAKA
jgi:Ser/Thr protein kinase RdoA (MazF antagonist)